MADPHRVSPLTDDPPVSLGYTFGAFRMDLATYQLFRDGEEVELTSKVFDTLSLLVHERHRVVTKEELLTAVWRDAVVTDDSLIQCISALRRALGDDAANPRFVATVARRGYRFIAQAAEWTAPVAHAHATEIVQPREAPLEAPSGTISPAPSARSLWRGAVWPVLTLVSLLLGWYVGSRSTGTDQSSAMPSGVIRFTQPAPRGTKLASGGALSPDGTHLAFTAEDSSNGRTRLWVRALDSAQLRAFEGTEGAARPFWSPDSQSIAFFADGRLKTVHVTGGPPTDLTNVGPRPAGGAWSSRGQIIFSTWFSGFSSISASGGTPTTITELGQGELAHAWPQFLPDGDHFIFSVYPASEHGTYVGSVSTGTRVRVLDTDAGTVYAQPGFLVFTRKGILTAQAFNVDTLKLTGEAFGVVSGNVVSPSMTNGTLLSASAGGLIAFGGATGESELAWFDRAGRRLGTLSAPVPLHNPALSPDQKQLFANSYPPAQSGVWVADIERGAAIRIVPDGSIPIPSPDGQRLAFTSSRQPDATGIFTARLGGTTDGQDDTVVLTPEPKNLTHWTHDGRYLVYQVLSPHTRQDLWCVSHTGNEPIPLVQSVANEIQGQVSPDGKWLAYASDESGKWEVYVQTFPSGALKQTVSPNGGAEPQWRADGRELFYLSEDRLLMVVDVTPGSTVQVGRPRPLFRPEIHGEATTYRSHYAATADGQRFLVDVLQDPALEPITVLFNWTARR